MINDQYNPYNPPATPSSLDDEFLGDTFDTGKWSPFDNASTGISADVGNKMLKVTSTTTDSANNTRGYYQALPSSDFTVVTRVSLHGTRDSYFMAGLSLIQDTSNLSSSDLYNFMIFLTDGTTPGAGCAIFSQTAYNSSWTYKLNISSMLLNYAWLRIRYNGTNWYFEISFDGIGWDLLYTQSAAFTATGVMLQCTSAGGNVDDGVAYFDFFRYKNSNDRDTLIGNW